MLLITVVLWEHHKWIKDCRARQKVQLLVVLFPNIQKKNPNFKMGTDHGCVLGCDWWTSRAQWHRWFHWNDKPTLPLDGWMGGGLPASTNKLLPLYKWWFTICLQNYSANSSGVNSWVRLSNVLLPGLVWETTLGKGPKSTLLYCLQEWEDLDSSSLSLIKCTSPSLNGF